MIDYYYNNSSIIILMFWTDKIEIIICLSVLLVMFPCLVAYSFRQLPQGVPVEMGMLIEGMDVLAAQIVLVLVLAVYFACREYKRGVPNAVALSRCMKGKYQNLAIASAEYKLKGSCDGKHISQQQQSTIWQIKIKQEMIFR